MYSGSTVAVFHGLLLVLRFSPAVIVDLGRRERGKSIGTTLGSIKGIIVYERTYLSFIQDKSSKLVCIICSVLIIFKLI